MVVIPRWVGGLAAPSLTLGSCWGHLLAGGIACSLCPLCAGLQLQGQELEKLGGPVVLRWCHQRCGHSQPWLLQGSFPRALPQSRLGSP